MTATRWMRRAAPRRSRSTTASGAMLALAFALGGPAARADCMRAPDGRCLPTECTFGSAQFNKLRLGMAEIDAFRILGCQGRLMRSSDVYGTPYELYRFDSQEPGSGALLDFHGSKLQDKVPIELH